MQLELCTKHRTEREGEEKRTKKKMNRFLPFSNTESILAQEASKRHKEYIIRTAKLQNLAHLKLTLVILKNTHQETAVV